MKGICTETQDCGFISENRCCRECEEGPSCAGFCVLLIPGLDHTQCSFYHGYTEKAKNDG